MTTTPPGKPLASPESPVDGECPIAGVVVLYNPGSGTVDAVRSYIDDLDILYAVDNSDDPDPAVISRLCGMERIVYLSNHGNLGIAQALNRGANEALAVGYPFLLTMDQDSTAEPGMVAELRQFLREERTGRVGIVAPTHCVATHRLQEHESPYDKVDFVMTSGNVLNLAAYREIGPFAEELFIDCVDYDYCIRLNLAGFDIVRVNGAFLSHNLGEISEFRILHKTLATSNHSPLRRYYNTRNRFFIWSKYRDRAPEFVREDRKKFIGEMRNVVFGEKKRLAKLRMMLRGYLDYRRNRFGKYRSE